MKKISTYFFTLLLIAVFAFPMVTRAKDDDDKEGEASKKNLNPCIVVPPGHFIAPGWLNEQGNEFAQGIALLCRRLTPGMIKKLVRTPKTPDTQAPVLSAVTVDGIMHDRVTLHWTTNEKATAKVWYGTVTPVDRTSANTTTVAEEKLRKDHRLTLSALTTNTKYYFVVASTDTAGNVATSTEQSFVTSVTPDANAPVLSDIHYSVTRTQATIEWNTNEPATAKVYYGATTPLLLTSSTTNTEGNTMLTAEHKVRVSGLLSATTYYFVVESKDESGNSTHTSEFIFRTAP